MHFSNLSVQRRRLFPEVFSKKSDGFLTASWLNPIKNKLNDRESQMTVLSPVTTHRRQEVLVGKWIRLR